MNPRRKKQVDLSVSLTSAWPAWQVPSHPRLHGETLSQNIAKEIQINESLSSSRQDIKIKMVPPSSPKKTDKVRTVNICSHNYKNYK